MAALQGVFQYELGKSEQHEAFITGCHTGVRVSPQGAFYLGRHLGNIFTEAATAYLQLF